MSQVKPTAESPSPLRRWEISTDLPLLVLALASIPILVLEINASGSVATAAVVGNWVIWAFFAMDLAIRLWLVGSRRWHYLWTHWFDVLIVVLAVLPFFRPLRIARSGRALRGLRSLRLIGFLGRFWTGSVRFWHGAYGRIIGVAVLVIVLAGSVGVWMFERHTDGPIAGFDDALWWSLTTVTTVGYGDTYPTTPEGRGIAVFLMLAGIAVFGVVSANLAALFISEPEKRSDEALRSEIAELKAMVHLLLEDRGLNGPDENCPQMTGWIWPT